MTKEQCAYVFPIEYLVSLKNSVSLWVLNCCRAHLESGALIDESKRKEPMRPVRLSEKHIARFQVHKSFRCSGVPFSPVFKSSPTLQGVKMKMHTNVLVSAQEDMCIPTTVMCVTDAWRAWASNISG